MLVGTLNFKKNDGGETWESNLKKKKKQIENGPTEEDFVIILSNK